MRRHDGGRVAKRRKWRAKRKIMAQCPSRTKKRIFAVLLEIRAQNITPATKYAIKSRAKCTFTAPAPINDAWRARNNAKFTVRFCCEKICFTAEVCRICTPAPPPAPPPAATCNATTTMAPQSLHHHTRRVCQSIMTSSVTLYQRRSQPR